MVVTSSVLIYSFLNFFFVVWPSIVSIQWKIWKLLVSNDTPFNLSIIFLCLLLFKESTICIETHRNNLHYSYVLQSPIPMSVLNRDFFFKQNCQSLVPSRNLILMPSLIREMSISYGDQFAKDFLVEQFARSVSVDMSSWKPVPHPLRQSLRCHRVQNPLSYIKVCFCKFFYFIYLF